VATSGRYARFGGLAGCLAAAAALVLACSGTAARATGADKPWCRARPTASWQRALAAHVVGLSRTTPLVPFALAHDGRSFFAAIYSRRFSGVGEIDARTSAVHKIKRFPQPGRDQANGAFDGRWLVWSEYHSLSSVDDFTVWAWDSRTGRVRQIGAATRRPDGAFWSSPLRGPDVRAGIATWVQGVGPGGIGAVHAYNLRTGRGMVVHRGHAQSSFLLDRHRVAWPESPSPGAETRMRVASVATGKRLRVPRALRELRGISGLATDGRGFAYPGPQYGSLWWSPSLAGTPQRIARPRAAGHVDDSVQVSGRYVGFGIWPRLFLADTRTRSYLPIGDRGGWTEVDKTALLTVSGSAAKAIHARLTVSLVPLRDVPQVPACP
jgi:hypothetical protein